MSDFLNSVQKLTNALDDFASALYSLSKTVQEWDKQQEKNYKNAGLPFGTSNEAYRIWREYNQQTTTN